MNPLCVIQARSRSTRLPGKMLLPLGGETLIARAHRLAVEAFGGSHVVVATPESDEHGPLADELERIRATVFNWSGPEHDVLSRLYHCAHRYRWHPQSVIVRWTPDDPFKVPDLCCRTAEGERHPVELGCEAFTLGQLARAFHTTHLDDPTREHIGNHRGLFPAPPLPCPEGCWTIDTPEDYEQAQQRTGLRLV